MNSAERISLGEPRRSWPMIGLATIALFLAVFGSAFALGRDSVRARHIKDGAVKRAKIANTAVNLSKRVGASGVVTNTAPILAGIGCFSRTTFSTPGVKPGDVVVVSVGGSADASVYYTTNTVPEAGRVRLRVCSVGQIPAGGLAIGYVALR